MLLEKVNLVIWAGFIVAVVFTISANKAKKSAMHQQLGALAYNNTAPFYEGVMYVLFVIDIVFFVLGVVTIPKPF